MCLTYSCAEGATTLLSLGLLALGFKIYHQGVRMSARVDAIVASVDSAVIKIDELRANQVDPADGPKLDEAKAKLDAAVVGPPV